MSSEYQYRVKRHGEHYLSETDPLFDTLEEALGRALSFLLGHARTPTTSVLTLTTAPADEPARTRVDLHCIQPGLVLPVGVGSLADSVRALLAGGFDGWRVPELPAEPEPLANRAEQLPLKVRNVLARHHFQWVEEVALVPDRAFQAMRNMGELSLQRLRAAIPAHTPHRDPAGQPLDDKSGTVVALSRGRGDAPAEVHRESLVEMITIRGSSNVEAFAAASRWLAAHPDQTLFGVDYDYTPYELSDGDPETHPCVLRLTVG